MLHDRALRLLAPLVPTLALMSPDAFSQSFTTSGYGCLNRAVRLSIGDDEIARNLDLGFAFGTHGSRIDVDSNGYVYLTPNAVPLSNTSSGTNAVLDFSSLASPSIAVLGIDLVPNYVGAGGLYFDTDGATVATLTWLRVPRAGSSVRYWDLQLQLRPDGSFVTCYRNTGILGQGVVGYSPGRIGANNASNPGARDLSSGTVSGTDSRSMVYEYFNPSLGSAWDLDGVCLTWTPNQAGSYDVTLGGSFLDVTLPIGLEAAGPLHVGASFEIRANNVPLGASVALLQLGGGTAPVPWPLSQIGGPPGCDLQLEPAWFQVPMSLQTGIAALRVPSPCDPLLVGITMHMQALIADLTQASTWQVPLFTSNVGSLTLGPIRPGLRFVVEGARSFYGNPAQQGFFRLESGWPGAHPPIVQLTVDLQARPQYFKVSGLDNTLGSFMAGNGQYPSLCPLGNAYYGSDLDTGLLYGPPQFSSSCDRSAFVGWIGSNGTSSSRPNTLRFDFAPGEFAAGERFGFDCEVSGGFENAGSVYPRVTVTFADGSAVSGTAAFVNTNLSELVLLP